MELEGLPLSPSSIESFLSSPGVRLLSWSEAPLIFIAVPQSHGGDQLSIPKPGCWRGLSFLQASKIWPSQITCGDEQSLFPWDGGRKQEQTVQVGGGRYLSFLQKLVSTPNSTPHPTLPPVNWE